MNGDGSGEPICQASQPGCCGRGRCAAGGGEQDGFSTRQVDCYSAMFGLSAKPLSGPHSVALERTEIGPPSRARPHDHRTALGRAASTISRSCGATPPPEAAAWRSRGRQRAGRASSRRPKDEAVLNVALQAYVEERLLARLLLQVGLPPARLCRGRGRRSSDAIGTLVERTTRFTLLLHLPRMTAMATKLCGSTGMHSPDMVPGGARMLLPDDHHLARGLCRSLTGSRSAVAQHGRARIRMRA